MVLSRATQGLETSNTTLCLDESLALAALVPSRDVGNVFQSLVNSTRMLDSEVSQVCGCLALSLWLMFLACSQAANSALRVHSLQPATSIGWYDHLFLIFA